MKLVFLSKRFWSSLKFSVLSKKVFPWMRSSGTSHNYWMVHIIKRFFPAWIFNSRDYFQLYYMPTTSVLFSKRSKILLKQNFYFKGKFILRIFPDKFQAFEKLPEEKQLQLVPSVKNPVWKAPSNRGLKLLDTLKFWTQNFNKSFSLDLLIDSLVLNNFLWSTICLSITLRK